MDTQQMILEELRSFREAVTEWQQQTGERVAALETHVKSGITGNGTPSRLQVVESSVSELNRWRWRIAGIAAGVSGVVSIIGWFVVAVKK